jgi:menaquinone-dependent protoporphyrinogen oxidase
MTEVPPPTTENATETTRRSDDGRGRSARCRRLLVLVDDACTFREVCTSVRAHRDGRPLDALIVAPAHASAATQWYVDEDAARAEATHRLRACVGCLARDGVRARALVGDPDPVQAIADALAEFPADEILMVSAPRRPSGWLGQEAIDRARRSFPQPITHYVGSTTPPATKEAAVNVLVTAASQRGATQGIAEAIGRTLREHDLDVTVAAPDEIIDVDPFDAFVIGSAVYVGQWLEPATAFVQRFAPILSSRPVWLFSSGPVGDPARKLVQKMAADPVELPQLRELTNAREHRILAGKLLGKGLRAPQRLSLFVFRGIEGDWRDWAEIERYATTIADALTARTPRVEKAV